LRAFRICKTKYVTTTLSGFGAREYGGRWNSVGTGVVYLSVSIALAALEVLAHTDGNTVPNGPHSVVTVEFPDDAFEVLDSSVLRPGWNSSPAPEYLAAFGDEWVMLGEKPLLRVQSAIVPQEFNFVFNPGHALADLVREVGAEPFVFDSRLRGDEAKKKN
jgi:RES domain-containing protein